MTKLISTLALMIALSSCASWFQKPDGGAVDVDAGSGEPCIKAVSGTYTAPSGYKCKKGDLYLTKTNKCTQQESKCSSITDAPVVTE